MRAFVVIFLRCKSDLTQIIKTANGGGLIVAKSNQESEDIIYSPLFYGLGMKNRPLLSVRSSFVGLVQG